MKKFRLKIATLERVVFDEDVDQVTLPGESGEFGVLAGHAPLITSLKLGEITARQNGEVFHMIVSGGMVEVQNERTLVLAEEAELADEIDEKVAESARARAEAIMKEKLADTEGFAEVEAELQKSLLRIKVVRKHRSRKGKSPL